MKCLFLYNPASGKGRIAGQTAYIRRRLEEAYDIVEIVETKSAEDMEARAREGAASFDVILFAGGDGTFNRILQGVGERDVRLGYIPGGTTNDTARSLGIPRSVKGALNVILAGNCAAIDVMRLNGTHYAVYVAAAGAFTRATYSTGRSLKKKLGILAYAVEALRHEMKFRVFPVTITCDGRRFEETTVLILNMNGRSIAGLKANKRSSMRDGKIELALIRQSKEPNFVRRMGAYASLVSLMLMGGKGRSGHILRLQGSHFLIETDGDVVWDLDGEKGMRGDLRVDVLPGHMKLFVPRKKKI